MRAAALEAAGAIGQPLVAEAPAALHDAAWQVRVGAVRCLGAADPETAVGPLRGATADSDADVRAYARRALAG